MIAASVHIMCKSVVVANFTVFGSVEKLQAFDVESTFL